MRECRCWCRVGQVIGWNVNGLNRCNRTLIGRCNPFLQRAHIGRQRWLITHGRWNAAEQSGHFRASLCKAEYVVHEEQNVLTFFVTEIFRHRQTGQGNTRTRSGRLVHLAEHQTHFGFTVQLDNTGIDHFVVKVVPFTGPFTNAREHGNAAVAFCNVVDQFLNRHGLANTGATEQTNLAALLVRTQQIDHFNTGDQLFFFRRLIDKSRGRTVNWVTLFGFHRRAVIHRVTGHVQNTAENFRTHRNGNRITCIQNFLTADQAISRIHRDTAHGVFTQVLRDFEHEGFAVVLRRQRVQNGGHIPDLELHIDNSAENLCDFTSCLSHFYFLLV